MRLIPGAWSLAVSEFRMAVYPTQTLDTQCLALKRAGTKKDNKRITFPFWETLKKKKHKHKYILG